MVSYESLVMTPQSILVIFVCVCVCVKTINFIEKHDGKEIIIKVIEMSLMVCCCYLYKIESKCTHDLIIDRVLKI